MRAAGKLADTAPVYGLAQWRREPAVTRLAHSLALAHGYGLHESLAAARKQVRDERRRTVLAKHVETLIRSRHRDPVRAAIAATTLDIDAVAAELTARSDVAGWAKAIGADLLPPPVRVSPAPVVTPMPVVTPPVERQAEAAMRAAATRLPTPVSPARIGPLVGDRQVRSPLTGRVLIDRRPKV